MFFCPFEDISCGTRLLSAVTGLFWHLLNLSCEEEDNVVQRSLLWWAGCHQGAVGVAASVCLAGGITASVHSLLVATVGVRRLRGFGSRRYFFCSY